MTARSARAAKAMAHLPEHDPALAALGLWCTLTDGPGPTATHGTQIRVGPEFGALPLREQIGLLGHHILHIALRHSARQTGMRTRQGGLFDAQGFNLAADALVNAVIEAGGHALPRPAVTLQSLCAEVLKLPPEEAQVSAWDVERLYIALQTQDAGGQARQARYAEQKAFAEDLEDAETGEDSMEDADWQGHLERALKGQTAAGRGIGPVLARLADLPKPFILWERRLRRLLGKAVLPEQRLAYTAPRRRWVAAEADAGARGRPHPAFEPSQPRDRRQPRIVICVDSSGSIPDLHLHQFAGEVAGIARRHRAEVHVLLFDAHVYDHLRLTGPSPAALLEALQTRRDGGTSFVDVLERAGQLDPSAVVLLTDLDGPIGEPPHCPVIWAVTQPPLAIPPFGDVLLLDI